MRKTKLLTLFYILQLLIGCDKSEKLYTTIETLDVLNITAYSAELIGTLVGEDNLQILTKGFCWDFEPDPVFHDNSITLEGGYGTFNYEATQLRAGMAYYVRAFYTTEKDTLYGNQVEFKTPDYLIFNPYLEYGTVTDIDGNAYKIIEIGEQTWMAENLRTTRYQNGDPIEHVKDYDQWYGGFMETGSYIYYNYDGENKEIHGALYNWNAAVDERNIAPIGWRVPSVQDWQKLIDYLDTYNSGNYGHTLRETTTAHWYFYDHWSDVATNSTGYTAIPSGFVHGTGCIGMGYNCRYWTSTGTPLGPNYVSLCSEITFLADIGPAGYIIRCIKE